MAYEFMLPDIGEGVVEGEIVKWLVKEGDTVAEDQPLVEVMTDKATVTIPSPKRGKVTKLYGAQGSIAKVHEPLVALDEDGGAKAAAASAPAAAAPAPAAAAPRPAAPAPAPAPPAAPAPAPAAAPSTPLREGTDKVLATPVTRRIAAEHGVDLRAVPGSGPQGRVLKKDVLAALEHSPAAAAVQPAATPVSLPSVPPPAPAAPPPAPVVSAQDERMPMRGLRKAIFRKMAQSEQFAVPFTYVDEVDMTAVVGVRERINAHLAKDGVKLSFLPFITKALIAGLRKYPHLNGVMDEEKQELIIRKAYNIGIGVATDAGLTVAVVHDADRRTIRNLGEEIERLARAARENKLSLPELTGSTFTITSLGKDGGMFATPVINHPEVAILGIHRIEQRPVVVDRQIVIRDRMYMSCSFDHRVIDGHVGAAFVSEVKRYLENPDLLLLELA
jgi:pyruvate dehydrogenase E2 component (dihydrolipoamide acetyltransferase)